MEQNLRTIAVIDAYDQNLYIYSLSYSESWELEKFLQENNHSADYRVVFEVKNIKDKRNEQI
jgi:hypothetical protein